MQYLLDTSIISDLIRDPQGRATAKVAAVGQNNVCTSIIVACELRFGIAKRKSLRLTRQVEAVLAQFEVLPLKTPIDVAYGGLREPLEARGTPIGGNDLLIAAHALSISAVLVTANEREYARVPGLTVENWLR